MFSINNTGCSVYSLISSTGFETVRKLKVFFFGTFYIISSSIKKMMNTQKRTMQHFVFLTDASLKRTDSFLDIINAVNDNQKWYYVSWRII